MAYTYDDFEKAATAAGLLGNFSQYDLDLARAHPEAGLSLLSLKQDWNNATTAEAKMLANEAANQIRSSYGAYTGGKDGSKYYAETPQTATSAIDAKAADVLDRIGSYGSFAYGNQDAYNKALQGVVDIQPFTFNYGNQTAYQKALDDVAGITPFAYDKTAPVYTNPYEQQQAEMLDRVVNREGFAYDPATDPVYGSYKKAYLREGDRATANALAQASAGSGGRASTAAVNAATQAGDYYATKLSDVIPTLYQQAFDRYLQDYQMKLSDLGAVNQQQQLDYARYLNELGQYNTDRGFALDTYNADVNRRQGILTAMMNDRGQQWQEQKGSYDSMTAARLNALSALTADRGQAYNEYLDGYNMLRSYLGDLQGQSDTIYTRTLAAAQQRKQQEQQALENQMALAQLGYGVGDNAYLEALGITPNNEALLAASLAAAGRSAPIGSGGSGGTGGTGGTGSAGGGGKWAALESWVQQYGDASAEDYIDEHYKELGYSSASAAKAGWKNYQLEKGGGGNGVTDAFKNTVLATYPNGVVTDPDDWQTLLGFYDEATLNAAGITNGSKKAETPTASDMESLGFDQNSVLELGYGPISEARLSELIDQGLVEMYVENGKIRFRRIIKEPTPADRFDFTMGSRFTR